MNLNQQKYIAQSGKAPSSFHRSVGAICISSAVLLGSVSTSASADVEAHAPLIKSNSDESSLRYIATNASFRADNPLRLFIQTGIRGDRRHQNTRRRGQGQRTNLQQHQVAEILPDYIIPVASAREADLVIRVRQTDYNLDFRVIDVDQKDKKYKKDRRYVGGRCGVFHKAYYTKVKEKGEAYASYKVAVRLKGISQDRDQFTLRAAKNFSYGTNLRAATNCGLQSTQHMPSKKVVKLFGKADPGYRHRIATQIRGKAINDLSRQIARRVLVQADYFYTDLAARLSHQNNYEEERHLHGLPDSLLQLSNLLWRYAKHRDHASRDRATRFGH